MASGRSSTARAVPDALRLLAEVAGRVDDDMLREIARADYGMNEEGYLVGLRRLRDDLVLAPIDLDRDWDHEVLQLVRWSRPDQPGWQPGGAGERGHWMRLFCCIALVMRDASVAPDSRIGEVNDSLGPMLESIAALDVRLADPALAFVASAMERTDPLSRAFLGLGALLLERMRVPADPDRMLAAAHALTAWVEAAEATEYPRDAGRWLFGLTWHDLRHDTWFALIARLLLATGGHMPALVAAELESLGRRLLPDDRARAPALGEPAGGVP